MKTKLSLAMLALLPFAAFGQSLDKSTVKTPKLERAVAHAQQITNTANSPLAYCIPGADCTDGDLITNVTFGTINNTTTCGTAGYNDFTAMSTQVTPGTAMPMSVTVGAGWYERVSVWVDLNNNQTFEDSERLSNNSGPLGTSGNNGDLGLGGGSDFAVTTLTGNITIPSGTAAGSYRMRVYVRATGANNPAPADPCLTGNYGEAEDYTLVVPVVGCLTAPNGQYPSATFTPTCNGSFANITAAAWTGEYSKVNVVAGTAYTFASSLATYFITISDEAGTTALAAGTGSVVYTPTTSGVVRFYTHLSSNCDNAQTSHARMVKCGTPPPPPTEPTYGCDQTYDGVWDLANNITKNLTATASYAVANDFFVPMGLSSYKLKTIKATVVPLQGGADIASVNVKILADNAGAPGSVIYSADNVVPIKTQLTATFAGYTTFDLTVDMANYSLPVNATAATRYWVSLSVNSAAATPASTYWIGYKLPDGWLTKPNYQTADGGTTYAVIVNANAPGQKYDSNWVTDADCVTLGVNESSKNQVSFHPNPVKDYLNISSKSQIETVHIYNVAGQKMPVSSTVTNGRIDMSKLAPGVYIISTILKDGKNESFKVVKQ